MITISQAMTLAHVDHAKFNDAVHRGHYPCARPTEKCYGRWFDEIDVVGLVVFGRLLDAGSPPRIAGARACEIVAALRNDDGIGSWCEVRSASGDEVERVFTRGLQPIEHNVTNAAVFVDISIVRVREYVQAGIDLLTRQKMADKHMRASFARGVREASALAAQTTRALGHAP